MVNITKNITGECVYKFTTLKLIAYKSIIPTNNIRKYKCSEYSCFLIYNIDVQI